MSDAPKASDFRSIQILNGLLEELEVDGREFTAEIMKTADDEEPLRRALDGECTLRLERPEFPEDLTIFGTRVSTGPVAYIIPKARARNAQAVREFLDTATLGETINIAFEVVGSIKVRRLAGGSGKDVLSASTNPLEDDAQVA